MAEGGLVKAFCATNQAHKSGCQYFADGGMVASQDEVNAFLNGGEAPPTVEAPVGDIASPEEVSQFLKEEQYGTPMEQAKTFAQNTASAVTGGLSTAAQIAMGDDPEAIRARDEVNPGMATAGQVTGVAGSMLTGTGAGALAVQAGKQAAKVATNKVAAAAVRQAAEAALIASGNEVSKMFAQDPRQSAETAMVNIGLSGLLGGASGGLFTGVVEPLALASKGMAGKLAAALEEVKAEAVGKMAASGMDMAVDLLAPRGTRSVLRLLKKALPDEGRDAFLKFLAKDGPVDAIGFQAMANAVKAIQKGAKASEQAVQAVFKSGVDVLPANLFPSEDKVKKLNQMAEQAMLSPEPILNATGSLGAYLPDHAEAMGEAVARSVQYINSIRPASAQGGVLDDPAPLNSVQTSAFNRALQIVEQPLVVLTHVKNGSITPADVSTIKATHPHFYASLGQKLIDQMIIAKDSGVPISYTTKLGLSAFLQMPLDSSISPYSIMVNGMAPSGSKMSQQVNGGQPNANPGAIKSLSNQAMTQEQASSSRRFQR